MFESRNRPHQHRSRQLFKVVSVRLKLQSNILCSRTGMAQLLPPGMSKLNSADVHLKHLPVGHFRTSTAHAPYNIYAPASASLRGTHAHIRKHKYLLVHSLSHNHTHTMYRDATSHKSHLHPLHHITMRPFQGRCHTTS